MAAAREGNLEAPTRHPIAQGFDRNSLGAPQLEHPISLVRMAYGLK